MKYPQTKFHTDTMSNSKDIRSKKVKIFCEHQNFLAPEFFSLLIFYQSYNNAYWCAFASLVALLEYVFL